MTQSHEFTININSRPRKVEGEYITFEDVLKLGGVDTTGQDLGLYEVEWTHGNEAGSLTPGNKVKLHNGMKFDAGKSNRS